MNYPIPLRFVVYVSVTYGREYRFGQRCSDRCNGWVLFAARPTLVAGLGSLDQPALIGFHRLEDPLMAESGYPRGLPTELAQISDTDGWCRAHMLNVMRDSILTETIPAWGSDEWRTQFAAYAADPQQSWLQPLLPALG